jgi:hypothetical protein
MLWTNRSFKDEVYGHLARIGKATSSPKRLELLQWFSENATPSLIAYGNSEVTER